MSLVALHPSQRSIQETMDDLRLLGDRDEAYTRADHPHAEQKWQGTTEQTFRR